MFSIFSPENRAVCEIMQENMVQSDTDGNIIAGMLIACLFTKAAHSE
jgi:hypothetical protein